MTHQHSTTPIMHSKRSKLVENPLTPLQNPLHPSQNPQRNHCYPFQNNI